MTNRIWAILLIPLIFVGFERYGSPQTTSSTEIWQFDVASVKASNPNATIQDARIDFPSPNRFEAQNMTLKEILHAMIGFSSLGEVQGGPGWVQSARYDISAKCDREIPSDKRNEIVMNLLRDRFRL